MYSFYTVLHNQKFLEFQRDPNPTIDPNDLRVVAQVRAYGTSDAYRLTQHVDQPWYDNERVTTLIKSRSTSIGDVIAGSLGALVVVSAGFLPLEQFVEQGGVRLQLAEQE